tara:strand:- start:221 stop:457 length:237 start_codon:yes stop_codon:yes gene_type:complete
MKTQSIFLLIIFLFIHYIAYIFVKSKYDDKVKQDLKLQYMVPPITYEDYFVFKDLDKFYGNLFSKQKNEINLIKTETL